jgi:hypothetical protein
MSFTYKLTPGIATSTNALKLMQIVGLDLGSEGDRFETETPRMPR